MLQQEQQQEEEEEEEGEIVEPITYGFAVGKKRTGGAGYRSRYLSHAKRALYHLSYAPGQ